MERITQYLKKMRRVLTRRGQKHQDIEDLMQDAFVRILEYTKAGHQIHQPEAILVRTAQRLALNHTRDQHHDLYTKQPIENLTIIDPNPAPQEVLEAEQCLKEIKATLDALSPRTRHIFFLQRLHGYSYAQIAQQTGTPISTVEKHIARAMTALLEQRRTTTHFLRPTSPEPREPGQGTSTKLLRPNSPELLEPGKEHQHSPGKGAK